MKLTHPLSGQVITAADGDEGRYLSEGWQVVTKTKPAAEPVKD